MSLAYHCDRDGCDTWIKRDAGIPNGFVSIYDSSDDYEPIAHCCSIDCLMHWAASHSAPTEARSL